MDRIVARSRAGFWTAWTRDGKLLLALRTPSGEQAVVGLPASAAAKLEEGGDAAFGLVREAAASAPRLADAPPTPLVGSMGTEPDPHEPEPCTDDERRRTA